MLLMFSRRSMARHATRHSCYRSRKTVMPERTHTHMHTNIPGHTLTVSCCHTEQHMGLSWQHKGNYKILYEDKERQMGKARGHQRHGGVIVCFSCTIPVYQRCTIHAFIPPSPKTNVCHSLLPIIQRSNAISYLILSHVSFPALLFSPSSRSTLFSLPPP